MIASVSVIGYSITIIKKNTGQSLSKKYQNVFLIENELCDV